MDILPLLLFEDRYTACCCAVAPFEDAYVVRFRDALIPDMYDHNYSRIKQTEDAEELKALILREIAFCRAEDQGFCNLYLNGRAQLPFAAQLPAKPEETRYTFYACDTPAALRLKGREDCVIGKVSTAAMVDARLALELAEYGDAYGREFLHRKNQRMQAMYFAPGGIDCYLCTAAGEAVGKCDMLVENGLAKIEDFDVSPLHRRQGFGTAILRKLVEDAMAAGAKTVYMVADDARTAGEMYLKLGFAPVAHKTQLFFDLT